MKHSTQIITFLSAKKPAYGSMPLEPAETRPIDPIFLSPELLFQGTIS